MKNRFRLMIACILVVVCAGVFIACDSGKVVFTTGFSANEVFRIGSEKATHTELMLYITNIANQYEMVYGEDIWNIQADEDVSLMDNLKEMAVAQLAQIKAMKLLAKEHELTLSDEEKSKVNAAAEKYLDSLSQTEKDLLGIEEGDVVEQIYTEKLLADKLYAFLIRDVNPEISDDEARIITIQHILLKTYYTDENGNRQEMSDTEKEHIYQKAKEIYDLTDKEENFETLISKYSEDTKGTYSFGMGEMEEELEKVSFALDKDEISDVVQTSHGYHIIKCISTLDRDQTDINKKKLLISRKQEVFGSTYNAFIAALDKRVNTELIATIAVPKEDAVDTMELFAIYDSEFHGLFVAEEK